MEEQRRKVGALEISAAVETSTAPKRRKVRKGTQSCWECKRRKTRCTFASSLDTICDGCKSRQTRCLGQEFHDAVPLPKGKVDRLSRVEFLVEQLVKQGGYETPERSDLLTDRQYGQQGAQLACSSKSTDSGTEPHQFINTDQASSDYDDIRRALVSGWPSRRDIDSILKLPVGVSALLHGIVCKPYSDYFSGKLPALQELLHLPSQDSHPVLIARRLLLLATYLQGIPPHFASQLNELTLNYKVMMSRVFNLATRLVTSNDELTNSLEGIECIMIESMYLNNDGKLRRAWLANRRAMSVAQMIGLHGSIKSSGMFLADGTRERIDPDHMWFRIVCSDRYLSLMLGLRQCSPEAYFASADVLDKCTSVERMERLETVAAGLILQRNDTKQSDLATTEKIDKLLQEAGESMPPGWWASCDFAAIASGDGKSLEESVRFSMQLTHYHLLVQLHLPCMVRPSSADSSYSYSKLTAASASRAIITQFVSFDEALQAAAYCRGVDFIAFIASTTLCLAHIEARRDSQDGINVFQSLQHQRSGDRGLLERLLGIMERKAREYDDMVARKISILLRPLLDIEQNSFKGTCYEICASGAVEPESRCVGQTSAESHELRIQIPHFGTIVIQHRSQSHVVSQTGTADSLVLDPVSGPDEDSEPEGFWNADSIRGFEIDVEDWALEGVDTALFSNLIGYVTNPN